MNIFLLIILIFIESLLVFILSLFIFYKKFIKPFMKKFETSNWSSFWGLVNDITVDTDDSLSYVNEDNV